MLENLELGLFAASTLLYVIAWIWHLRGWKQKSATQNQIAIRILWVGWFLHFAMVGVMLTRAAITHGVIQLATSALVFSGFAIWFGIVLFTSPVKGPPSQS